MTIFNSRIQSPRSLPAHARGVRHASHRIFSTSLGQGSEGNMIENPRPSKSRILFIGLRNEEREPISGEELPAPHREAIAIVADHRRSHTRSLLDARLVPARRLESSGNRGRPLSILSRASACSLKKKRADAGSTDISPICIPRTREARSVQPLILSSKRCAITRPWRGRGARTDRTPASAARWWHRTAPRP